MARSTPDFPIRVLAIAVGIVVVLGLLIWFSSGLGTPPEPPPDGDGDVLAPEPGLTDGGEEPANGPNVPSTGSVADLTTDLTLQLYLLDGSRRLAPRTRRVQAPVRLPAQAQLALDRLIDAGEPGYVSPLPAGTRVREVWFSTESGTAFVDFADNLPDLLGGGSLTEIHAVYAVVGTLTSTFPEIRQVQILVAGRPVDTLNGHLDLSVPLEPSSDWLY